MKQRIALSALGALAIGIVPAVYLQEDKVLTGVELKAMVQNLGYTTKDLTTEPGKEKVEFKMSKGGLDIPVSAEVSPSTRFIWLTVFLGDTPTTGFESKAAALLRQNGKIQPTQFYVTEKGRLMVALAVDNRNVNPAVLRHRVEKLVADVADSQSIWSNKSN